MKVLAHKIWLNRALKFNKVINKTGRLVSVRPYSMGTRPASPPVCLPPPTHPKFWCLLGDILSLFQVRFGSSGWPPPPLRPLRQGRRKGGSKCAFASVNLQQQVHCTSPDEELPWYCPWPAVRKRAFCAKSGWIDKFWRYRGLFTFEKNVHPSHRDLGGAPGWNGDDGYLHKNCLPRDLVLEQIATLVAGHLVHINPKCLLIAFTVESFSITKYFWGFAQKKLISHFQ